MWVPRGRWLPHGDSVTALGETPAVHTHNACRAGVAKNTVAQPHRPEKAGSAGNSSPSSNSAMAL